jgi:Uma2 family endonuclease
MAAGVRPVAVPFTYREYALLPDDGRRYEIMQGDLFVTPAPSPLHQMVSKRLQMALMRALEEPGLAFVYAAPIDVILSPKDIVQPDLVVVRAVKRSLITKRAIEGPPDLVIEILSPHGQDRDEYLKAAFYARFGIPEYWVVDPDLGRVQVRRLGATGYEVATLCDRASVLVSPEFPELRIPLEPVFREI